MCAARSKVKLREIDDRRDRQDTRFPVLIQESFLGHFFDRDIVKHRDP